MDTQSSKYTGLEDRILGGHCRITAIALYKREDVWATEEVGYLQVSTIWINALTDACKAVLHLYVSCGRYVARRKYEGYRARDYSNGPSSASSEDNQLFLLPHRELIDKSLGTTSGTEWI